MKIADVRSQILAYRPNYLGLDWFYTAAKAALLTGRYKFIAPRKDPDSVYLARFWLNMPHRRQSGELDSGNSALLHWIIQPDDDEHLHTHPWPFRTTILNGGYTEQRKESSGNSLLMFTEERRSGQTVSMGKEGMHRIASVRPDTWTLVQTGNHDGSWGFQVGPNLIDAREYLR